MSPDNPDEFDDPADAHLDRRDNRTAVFVAVIAVFVVAVASFVLIIGVTSAKQHPAIPPSPTSSPPQ